MTVPVITRLWRCANKHCLSVAQTGDSKTPFHRCRYMAGLNIPLVPQGVSAKVEAVERGDYAGKELVQVDANGRPVMSAVVTRDHGQDTAIYAPCAQASIRDFM